MRLTEARMKDLQRQVSNEEISFSRMVELINEEHNKLLTDDEISQFAQEAVTLDGSSMNEVKELVAKAVKQGAEWMRWKMTGKRCVPSAKTEA
jgi:predicted lactoylglutathione lyase